MIRLGEKIKSLRKDTPLNDVSILTKFFQLVIDQLQLVLLGQKYQP